MPSTMSGVDWLGRDCTPAFVISNRHAGTKLATLSALICVNGEWRWFPPSRPQAGQSFCACTGCTARLTKTSKHSEDRTAR